MKIAYLAKNIDPGSGGGRYALNVILGVRSLGHEVTVFKEEDDGHEGRTILVRGLGLLASAWRLRRALRDHDVVHALDIWPYGVHAYLAVLGTSKKLFVSGVGTYSVEPLEALFKRLILKRVLKRAQHIFCISEYVKIQMIKRLPLDNISVVHMGFTHLPSISVERRSYYRDLYKLGSRKPILLTVGAIKHRKGQLNTLKAVAKLKDKYPDILYIALGTMYESAYISKINKFAEVNNLQKNVLLVGEAKEDEALAFFYEQCDVFVMNSNNSYGHFEGFGLVFLEAGSFGKPVVGSSGCGIEDALKDGFNGYLVKQGDVEDIADKLEKALKNKETLGKRSLEFVKGFSWQQTASRYIEYYKS